MEIIVKIEKTKTMINTWRNTRGGGMGWGGIRGVGGPKPLSITEPTARVKVN